MEIKDKLAIVFSFIALIISLFALWDGTYMPYRLVVGSPAITQINSKLPSLMFDVSFYNSGARPAVIDAVRIKTSNKKELFDLVLHAQELVDPNYILGEQKLIKGKTKLS
ncbi:MAG: hypothetical protein GY795_23585, partial [Desulfobacterales bacterium]|nr:hypothetical protein [Desulfobacterales bacterium]